MFFGPPFLHSGKGYKDLNEGETVKFEVVNSEKGPQSQKRERLSGSLIYGRPP